MKKTNQIKKWEAEQYKKFALSKGFVLPKMPSDSELREYYEKKAKERSKRRNGKVITYKVDSEKVISFMQGIKNRLGWGGGEK